MLGTCIGRSGYMHYLYYMKTESHTETGITVGLIDAVLSISKILAPRPRGIHDDRRWPATIKAALSDLYEDKDVLYILTFIKSESPFVDDKRDRDLTHQVADTIRRNRTVINLS